MNKKQRTTLAAVFRDPVSGTIVFADIEALLVAAGCTKIERGNGSSVIFSFDGQIVSFHRPHPRKEAKHYQVRDARAFLIQIGVTP